MNIFSPSIAPVIIEDYVFVGPRVIIQPGVKIGKGAIVAPEPLLSKIFHLLLSLVVYRQRLLESGN